MKTFDGGVSAVGGVSFTIAPGGSLGLVGESGSGKSTLSRLICRLIDADAGDIIFDGRVDRRIPPATSTAPRCGGRCRSCSRTRMTA